MTANEHSVAPVPNGAPVRIGVDCESIARWQEILANQSHQITRLFDHVEHAHCSQLGDPAEGYAGLWCAKEAACKAVGTGKNLVPRDILIRHDESGRPLAVLPAPFAEYYSVDVSISHCEVCAIAVALVSRRSVQKRYRPKWLPVRGGGARRPRHRLGRTGISNIEG